MSSRLLLITDLLTYVSKENEDIPLTPSMLICGRNVCIAPPLNDLVTDDPEFVPASELREQYSKLSVAMRKFESSWQNDYLTSLRGRRYNSSSVRLPELKVGDFVYVDLETHLEKGHRSLLVLGRVVRLLPSADKIVRSVEVLVSGKNYTRPISKLIPLELEGPVREEESETEVEVQSTREMAASVRPKRQAAMRADLERQDLIREGAL